MHSFLLLLAAFLSLMNNPAFILGADDEQYTNCKEDITCGDNNGISYPFWGENRNNYCGEPGLELQCQNNVLFLKMMNISFRILEFTSNAAVKVARDDYWGTICPETFVTTTLNWSLFEYDSGLTNATFYYGCTTAIPGVTSRNCNINKTDISASYLITSNTANIPSSEGICSGEVIVPILTTAATAVQSGQRSIEDALKEGFNLGLRVDNSPCLRCEESGGACGYNTTNGGFLCLCQDKPYPATCNATNNPGKKTEIAIGLAVGGAILFGIFVGFYFYYFLQRKKKKLAAQTQSKELPTPLTSKSIATPSTNLSQTQSIPSYPSFNSKSDYDKGSTYFGVQVFSYAELEEATENFNPAKELGDGGFGTVYYGKLHDGRVVAVKRLYENNFKRVEQFMNEVEILTRLEHRNLVKLYGCTSRRSRELLLVYEYIPNGTVADHLHGKRVDSGFLSWPVRLSIAIETADALAFLHRSDVIHRDVKTNNILIDNEFCVKVADFGLSRLFPNDVTHVSTAPQGTPGYVDPEYYQCYQLTNKSDVYSFGVVLIELLSSLQAVDTNRHRHDINLANLAINKIQNHLVNELVDPLLGFETNYAVRRMATDVAELAFRCLQQERDMRPTMDEVLEGLKAIQNEEVGDENGEAVVLDIGADEVGLLRNMPPPLSPDSGATDKLVSSSTTPSSF